MHFYAHSRTQEAILGEVKSTTFSVKVGSIASIDNRFLSIGLYSVRPIPLPFLSLPQFTSLFTHPFQILRAYA